LGKERPYRKACLRRSPLASAKPRGSRPVILADLAHLLKLRKALGASWEELFRNCGE
jgi:hypothetical protein